MLKHIQKKEKKKDCPLSILLGRIQHPSTTNDHSCHLRSKKASPSQIPDVC